MVRSIAVSLFSLAAFASTSVSGFSVSPQATARQETSLNLFGNALKGAFGNENMGKKENAGLSNGPNYNDNVTVNGKAVPGAVVGQKLTVVAGRARVKIPVNCQKGDCGTCMVKVNGRQVKACQAALGSGKTTIETL